MLEDGRATTAKYERERGRVVHPVVYLAASDRMPCEVACVGGGVTTGASFLEV
jgi:hypothetical protein